MLEIAMILIIDYLAVILSIFFLAYGSWSDYKIREVSDIVWAIFAPIALAFTFFRVFLIEDLLIISLIPIGKATVPS